VLQLISRLPVPWQAAVTAALLGDAFGVPHEFKEGYTLPRKSELHMVMPDTYRKTYSWVPYGTWSDDGSQMMALLDALMSCDGRYVDARFSENMLAWLQHARYQAGGAVFDCGMQTRKALELQAQGKRYSSESARCGNGSLMRVLPVAAMPDTHGISRTDALRIAMDQSNMTHPQALARVCCALYVELAWQARAGGKGLRALMPAAGRSLLAHQLLEPGEQAALQEILAFGANEMPTNSGYVVNSLWSALWAVDSSKSLSDTLRTVVSSGRDTDTVACIAGGLAALVFGWDETAHEWRRQMQFPA